MLDVGWFGMQVGPAKTNPKYVDLYTSPTASTVGGVGTRYGASVSLKANVCGPLPVVLRCVPVFTISKVMPFCPG